MYRMLAAIAAVILALIGLMFVASRGGHEAYRAAYFKPGPALGLVKGLSDDALEGRGIDTTGSKKAQDMIVARMQALELLTLGGNSYRHGFEADTEGHGESEHVNGLNLIGAIQGSESSDKVIVITAHYDHLGIVDDEIYNGADDNASGVAALIAVAEHYSRKNIAPKHSMLFVVLDGEETGLLGAKAFLADPPLPLSSLAFNLNLDMISRADNGKLWASGTSHLSSLKPFLSEVAKVAPLDLEMGFDGADPNQDDWTLMSDHGAFYEAGIPHLYLGVESQADKHRPTDDFENIDQNKFLKSVDTVLLVAMALDEHLGSILPATSTPETSTAE